MPFSNFFESELNHEDSFHTDNLICCTDEKNMKQIKRMHKIQYLKWLAFMNHSLSIYLSIYLKRVESNGNRAKF